MLIFNEDEFVMVPMALNAFYYNIPLGTRKITYTKTVSIGEEFLDVLIEYIEKVPDGKYIIIDMQNSDYAFRLFDKFKNISKHIIFLNIQSASLREKMKENIPDIQMSADEKNATLNLRYEDRVDGVCSKYASTISHKVFAQIVNGLIEKVPENPIVPQKLDSSGLYSNMYVNVKKLFLSPKEYYAIAFGLAQKIVDAELEFDGFISSSKNGALLANLLGMMLDKKVIHIMGLGPKYSMNIGNVQKEIRKRKNYIYVFDFRCTGTEMKILSALVNANDAYIQCAAGIAIYKKDDGDTDKNMIYLVNISEEGISYKIAGKEEDIIKLME